jgi:hypothetical protein
MDRWMKGWMDGWVDGWMDGWMGGCVISSLFLKQLCNERDYEEKLGSSLLLAPTSLFMPFCHQEPFLSTPPHPMVLSWP